MTHPIVEYSRQASIALMSVGALNWGVTAVRLNNLDASDRDVPDLLDAIGLSSTWQMVVYAIVFVSGVWYSLSFLLSTIMPEIRFE